MKSLDREDVLRWASDDVDNREGTASAHGFLERVARDCRLGSTIDVLELTPFPERGLWFINLVISWAESKFMHSWHGHEWEMLCEVRSELEFFVSLWGETLAPHHRWYLDTEDLDDHFRFKAERGCEGGLPADRIPPGTPRSHWWWWL